MTTFTLRRMVRWGPWSFLGVHDKGRSHDRWERCEVEDCGKEIRYVHICQLDGEEHQWRIGSTCGPTLMHISEEEWNAAVRHADRDLRLLLRAQRLLRFEHGTETLGTRFLGSDWLEEIIELIQAGSLDGPTRMRKHHGHPTDLRVIQGRLRNAEKHHALPKFQMGAGR